MSRAGITILLMNENQPTPFEHVDTPDELQYWQFVAGDYSRHLTLYSARPPFIGSSGIHPDANFEELRKWLNDEAKYRKEIANSPVHELRSCELSFKKIIDYYLERTKAAERPTIAMDVGAMAATSWIRLGCAFREQIERGQLLLIATNRTYSPYDQGLDIPKMPDELKEFVRENQDLVHFLVADADSFPSLAVTLLAGESLRVMGNIDFAHESESLSKYSPDPERDIRILGRMISKNGIYLSHGGFPYSDHLPEDVWLDNPRFVAVRNAHRKLVNDLEFTLVTEVEEGVKRGADLIYAVFKKTCAPPIAFD